MANPKFAALVRESSDALRREKGKPPITDATFNQMDHPNYRATVRRISNEFHRLKGLPPVPLIEEERWNALAPAEAIVAWLKGYITDEKALTLTGLGSRAELEAVARKAEG